MHALDLIVLQYIEPLKVNHKLELDSNVARLLSSEEVAHRKHPGLVNIKQVQLPQKLLDAIELLVESKQMQVYGKKYGNSHDWAIRAALKISFINYKVGPELTVPV